MLPPSLVWDFNLAVMKCLKAVFLGVILLTGSAVAAPPGAIISNQATLEYRDAGNQIVAVPSNTVEVTTAVLRSPATIDFSRVVQGTAGTWQETVGPSACFQGGSFVNLADPQLVGGAVIDPTQVQEVVAASSYNLGEAMFVRLDDADQNVDYLVVDYAVVTISDATTGDSETIQLSETGPNTGVFAGYLSTSGGVALSGDCVLQSAPQSNVLVSYVDPVDSTDAAASSAVIDPVQRVFESRTGSAVSGATIEIVDAISGLPAVVFGNDGVSQFPSAIVSGGTTTDSSGTSYVFGPGEYRFPVVPDGDYRLIVTPPSEYSAPSTSDPSDLQNLPGAPYALGPGSFGASFSKQGDLSVALDIPVDPRAEALFLQKRTLTTSAAPGDFVRFELDLQNVSVSGMATNVRVVDVLPVGLRFVQGSARLNGAALADPAISADLRTLDFDIGDVAVAERIVISYVVEVISGALDDELVNRASAIANGGLVSNEATAMIRLTEDLFRSTGTIIGRVLEGDCSQDSFSEDQGVANIRVYLEDGRYAVTDEGGRFHFEGLTPGTHVAQLDTFSVPAWFDVIGCSDTPGFAGRADSQFVKLSQGSLLRADFYLQRKAAPEGRIDLEMRSREGGSAEQVIYDVKIDGIGNVAIENIDLMVLLPSGVSYEPGSMRVDGEHLGDPRVSQQVLSLALPDRTGNWTSNLSFVANIDADVSGEVSTKVLAKFDSPIEAGQQTPVAETKMLREPGVVANEGYVLNLTFDVLSDRLSAEDMLTLDLLIEDWQGVQDIQISAVGHSDSQPIRPRNQQIFENNYVLSRARANAAAAYVAAALGLDAASLQVAGRGPDEPVADNSTPAGRSKNRRVEMVMSGIRPSRPSFLEVTKATSGTQVAETRGAVPGMESARDANADKSGVSGMQDEPAMESLQPGVAILLPAKGFQPAIPVTKISIQHKPTQTVSVWINDAPVKSVNFDTTAFNADQTIAIARWKGVELREGLNTIRAVVADADGRKASTLERTINYSGLPVRGEIVAEESTLIADGKSRPVIAVRFFDRSGKPSRPGMVGTFSIKAPFRSWWDVDNSRKNPLVEIGTREATYRIDSDGIARIELEPTTRTGEVKLLLNFENYRQQELHAWMRPADRDWILVGFAEGTAGYNTLADNTVAAADAGNEDGYYDDGRVAFFAKGQIKGEYLLTLAYDSDKDRSEGLDELNTVVDPNRFYPLYADGAEQRFEAPSQRNLFVKLERNQFYALFGDMETGLTVTDLSRYQRKFNGVLSEYRGENVGFSVFAAESSQSFNRDELRGDGTSGLYQLSNAPIITNSEQIRIEVRDRFDSGQVLETTVLNRFLDYSLDTLTGSLYFKRPVPSRDENFNPVFIVAEYETRATSADDVVAGGRGSVRNSSDSLELGVTHISDQTQGAESDLTGVDLRWQISDQTLLRAEIAKTNVTSAGVETDGAAHLVELEHTGENVDVRAFIREVDDEFGLGYQSAADKGIRRLGIDVRAQLSERFYAEGEAAWQQNLTTEDIRNLARARVRYERQTFTASLGLAHAEDKFEDGDTRSSDLAELALSKKILDGRFTLRASGSTALNTSAENLDYPSTVVLGADYHVLDGVDLFAEYEEADGRDIKATMSRLGVRATPWARAQVNTSLTNEVSEYGPRLFANVGFIQGFQLSERWSLDVGLDQTNTLLDPNARQFDPDRELASGSLNDDFLALYTGALYSAELWSANARIEFRNSDSEERTSLLFGWYRQPTTGHGLSAGLTMFQGETNAGSEMLQADLRFGWAYRPGGSRWSFLNRTDLIFNNLEDSSDQERSWRLINNFNANHRFGANMQMSLQYAFKYVRSEFDGIGYNGFTDLIGFDLRRGMRGRWDVGINTSIYHSYQSKVIDYGAGVDVGYNVATNIWLSLGYNIVGFHDEDFTQARYTAQGPFLRFSIKADQRTLKDIAGQR